MNGKNIYPNLASATLRIRPNAMVSFLNDDINNMEWHENNTDKAPTKKEILAEYNKMVEEFKATEYARLRKAEYNKLNQLEMQFDDAVNGTNTWQEAIIAIKNKYPKGG